MSTPPPPLSTEPAITPPPMQTARPGMTTGKVLVFGLVLAMLGMWGYIFVTSNSYRPAGWLTNRSFPTAAEPICSATKDRLERLPLASEMTSAEERADVVDQATAELNDMLEQLAAKVPDDRESKFVRAWLKDWHTHLDDRRSYAKELRTNPRAEFMETPKEGGQMSKVLEKFANDNQMASCSPFEDV